MPEAQQKQPTPATHEFRTFHLALGHLQFDGPLELVAGSRSYPLQSHTSGSRALLSTQAGSSAFQSAPLSHFVENVPLRSDQVKLLHVRAARSGNVPAGGAAAAHNVLAAGLHLPAATRARCTIHPAKRALFQLTQDSNTSFLHHLLTTYDTATVVLLMNPELLNLDPNTIDQTLNVLNTCNEDLADSIQQQGSSWSVNEPLTRPDGSQWYDAAGKPGNLSLFSDLTTEYAALAAQPAIRTTKNLLGLQGHTWSAIAGKAFTNVATLEAHPPAPAGGARPTWAVQNLSAANGLTMCNIRNGDSSAAEMLLVDLDNVYPRHLSLYAEYLDGTGAVMPLSSLTFSNDDSDQSERFRLLDTDTTRLLGVLPPQAYVSGIAIGIEDNTQTVYIPIPAGGVVTVNLLCGGMGIGATDYPGWVRGLGIALTAIFEYAFPLILAAVDFGASDAQLQKLFSSDTASKVVDAGLRALLKDMPVTHWDPTDWRLYLIPVIKYAVTNVLPAIGKKIFPEVVAETTAEATDPVGWAAAAVSGIMTVLQLTATTADILQSPSVYSNTFSYSMTVVIALFHDPLNDAFPRDATRYSVVARFSNGTTVRRFDGALSNPVVPKLPDVIMPNVPAGGTITVEATFYADDGWIAGVGIVQQACALQGESQLVLEVHIKQAVARLLPDTLYQHKYMLDYRDRAYAWVDGPAPQETLNNLNIGQPNLNMTALQSLTYAVQQVSAGSSVGRLGYTWQGSSPEVGVCTNGKPTELGMSLYMGRVIHSADPGGKSQFSGCCGTVAASTFLFDLANPADTGFYLLTSDLDVPVTASRFDPELPPFGQSGAPLGRFLDGLPLDATTVFQSRFIAAISKDRSKLQILHLHADRAGARVPVASMLGGYGDRPGLMDTPVALTITRDSVLLVLEAGNARIQAFDEYGSPVLTHFGDSCFLSLQPAPGQTYLDIAVESVGFIYVLSYIPPANGDLTYEDYLLDIYRPDGTHLCQTKGFAAAKIDVDHWRNVWALNYHQLLTTLPVREPSLSLWTIANPS